MKFAWVLLLLLPLSTAAGEPAEVVGRFHAALLDNMKQGQALTCATRAIRLAPVVEATFDTPFLARFILRKQWSGLDEPQRQRFIAALSAFTVRSYAANFRAFDGEAFVTLGAEEQARGQKLVRSRMQRPGADAITFDYLLRQSADDWRVINVIAEGVSDLALRAAQYDKLYREQGFDALVAWIDSQGHNNNGC